MVMLGTAGLATTRAELEGHEEVPVSPELTLSDVVNHVYDINPTLHALAARKKEADALGQQAKSLFAADPTFRTWGLIDNVWSDRGQFEFEFGLKIPIWLPGQKKAHRTLAQLAGTGVGTSEHARRRWEIELQGNNANYNLALGIIP